MSELLRFAFLPLFCQATLLAQAAPQFHIHVLDGTQRPIPAASITLTGASGKVLRPSPTNTQGDSALPLSPGRYTLRVEHGGFEPQQTEIRMRTRDQQLNIALALQHETVSVTVSDQAARLATASDSHQDSLKFNASDLSFLPIRDGDVLNALSFFANPAGGQSPTVVVDGMERLDSVSLTPSQIQQVRLNNNAYSTEFAKPGKDRIEVDTKPGSDDVHGGFSFRTRDYLFDARNPLAATRPDFTRNGYEANLSGPIIPKRLFFFLSADRENQQQVQPILAYLPSGPLNQEVLAPFVRNLLLGRLDWQISEGHRASAKYEFHQDGASNLGVGGFVLPQAASTRFHHDYRLEFSDQYTLSPDALNNFRMALGTNYEQLTSQSQAPSVVVPGSFQQGGAQRNDWRREPRYEFQDTFSLVKGSLTLKAGAEARLHPFRSYSADNFGGTYQFASLSAFEANQPLLYTLNTGNPLLISDQDEYAWFLQAEKQWSRLTLFAGVRHEFQSHLSRYANLAPRLALAIALDRSSTTVLRIGGGVFYDRRPPVILQQAERFNGLNTIQYVIINPAFPVPDLSSDTALPPTARYQIDAAMTLPRIYQTSATLERQLFSGIAATAGFTYQRGEHLFRTRNINAPLPLTLVRPQPDEGNSNQIESSASSRGEIFNVTVKTPPQKRYQIFAQYTLSYLRDDTSDVFGPPAPGGFLPPGNTQSNLFALPANNYNLRPEWGPSANDIRHRFGLSANVHLPWRLDFGTLTSVQSGLPYDITTDFDNNGDTDPNDRPPGVTRNTGRGAGFVSVDVHLSRPVSFEAKGPGWSRKIDSELAVDSFNALNHTNPSSYVGVLTSPLFGQPNAAYNGREMQFSVRIHF